MGCRLSCLNRAVIQDEDCIKMGCRLSCLNRVVIQDEDMKKAVLKFMDAGGSGYDDMPLDAKMSSLIVSVNDLSDKLATLQQQNPPPTLVEAATWEPEPHSPRQVPLKTCGLGGHRKQLQGAIRSVIDRAGLDVLHTPDSTR
jgi:hypothetical protein